MVEQRNERHWKSLEELRDDPGFLAGRHNEFAEELPVEMHFAAKGDSSNVSRRDFMKLMGFSLAAVSAACSKLPVKKAIPYLNKPQEVVPGRAYWYASTCGGCSTACGILVKNRDGRPIKIEGNPESPLNRGGLCPVGQATVLDLYDSGRSGTPLVKGAKAAWGEVDTAVMRALAEAKAQGRKIRFLSRTVVSPTTKKLITAFLGGFADARHIVYDPVSVSALLEVHGNVLPHFDFGAADVIVSLAADFLGTWISPVEFTKQYTGRRRINGTEANHSHHVQFESVMSLTGANADVRVPVAASGLGPVAGELLRTVGGLAGQGQGAPAAALPAEVAKTVRVTAEKLFASRGRSLVVSGVNDPALQAVVARLNQLLGNYGKTLHTDAPSLQKQGLDRDMQVLIEEMERGEVGALIVYDVNPAYDWAEPARFAKALTEVGVSVALSRRLDETASLCTMVVPDHHPLESWNDAQPVAGLYHLSQPVIAPISGTRQAQDSLLSWMGESRDYLTYLKDAWQADLFGGQSRFADFTNFWNHALHDGVFKATAEASAAGEADFAAAATRAMQDLSDGGPQGLEAVLYPGVALQDGTNANNPWLQELPDPVSKVTWDNFVSLPVAYAEAQGLKQGDVVEIKAGDTAVTLPVFIQPGQAAGTVGIAVGYGRTHAGKVGNAVGKNVYAWAGLKDGVRRYSVAGVTLARTGATHDLACTQTHHSLEGRDIVRDTTLAEFLQNPAAGNKPDPAGHMLWQPHQADGPSWGMAIDLNQCTGCSSCIIGCQAENNIAVVGRDEVFRRREMHWIRVDRYYNGDENNPQTVFQPMTCQHCSNAPCESVCPVLATLHSSDGINQQVYNRCVGTRYCANNCPYKVRRFNWFEYANNSNFDYNMNDERGRLVLNPDVVVRSRGVMEKCSLCIQRIQEGKLKAKLEGRELRDDDIKTACQQSCPADAIVFGDLNNPQGRLARLLEKNPRRYHVLGELNTRPNVNYLTKVRNA